jgi:DNA-binding CsgD family transcriptional regulator
MENAIRPSIDCEEKRALLNLLELCNPRSNWQNKLSAIMFNMLRIFRASNAYFLAYDSEKKEIDLKNCIDLINNSSYINLYVNYYRYIDPLYSEKFGPAPLSPVFKTTDVISFPHLKTVKYYDDFLKPHSICQELIFRLYRDDKLFGIIDLVRSEDQPDYTDQDLDKGKTIYSYLKQFLKNLDSGDSNNQEQKLLRLWAEQQQAGTILIDYELTHIYCNQAAKKICFHYLQGRGLSSFNISDTAMGNFYLPNDIVEGCLELKRQYQAGGHLRQYENRIVVCYKRNRVNIRFRLVQAPDNKRELFFIINLHKLERYITQGVVEKDNPVLTHRERDVIQCVSEGLTNREIADKLFIGKCTVDTHISNILEKTGFRNRTQIINLIE